MDENNRSLIWHAFGQCWVDHPLEDTDFYTHLGKLISSNLTIEQIENEVNKNVCWGFSKLSFAAFISAGMALPDWFMPTEDIDDIRSKYDKSTKLFLFVNPFWLFGYRFSRYLVSDALDELRRLHGGPHNKLL